MIFLGDHNIFLIYVRVQGLDMPKIGEKGTCSAPEEARVPYPEGLRVMAIDGDRACLMILVTVLKKCQYEGLSIIVSLSLALLLLVSEIPSKRSCIDFVL